MGGAFVQDIAAEGGRQKRVAAAVQSRIGERSRRGRWNSRVCRSHCRHCGAPQDLLTPSHSAGASAAGIMRLPLVKGIGSGQGRKTQVIAKDPTQ